MDSVIQARKTLLLIWISLSTPLSVHSRCTTWPPVIFNFGDSNSDTGGLLAGLGLPIDPPNGRSFFHGESTGRLCDGRLIIDFLCESLGCGHFLSPYLDSVGSDFTNGVNFGIIGSSILPEFVPFNLNVQVMQFLQFKSRSMRFAKQGLGTHYDENVFRKALYSFDIGQNDLSNAFDDHLSYSQVVERIPSILNELQKAIQTIYDQGGVNFWIHNTGPLGCLPQKLSLQSKATAGGFDRYGCLATLNAAAKAFNDGLSALCDKMRSKLSNATIVYTDIFTIKYDLIINSIRYGFGNPLTACCGYGGPPYNYNINVTCGHTGSRACPVGLRYVSWDGVHYSEAANTIIASKILSTRYSKPQLKLDFFCNAV